MFTTNNQDEVTTTYLVEGDDSRLRKSPRYNGGDNQMSFDGGNTNNTTMIKDDEMYNIVNFRNANEKKPMAVTDYNGTTTKVLDVDDEDCKYNKQLTKI